MSLDFITRVAVVLMTAGVLTSQPLRGDDWPQFRGPTGQGLYQGALPVEWSQDKHVVWRQRIPGKGWSSPIVAGGIIYVTTAVPLGEGTTADQSLRALALDAVTGKILWQREVFRQDGAAAPRIHTKNSHASPTPVTDGKRLYVHFGHQGTACLDLDGAIRWRNSELKYAPVHGNGGSPTLVDGALVFHCDGREAPAVVALDAATGKVRWKHERKTEAFKKFSFGTPLVIDVDGHKQIISAGSDIVSALHPGTGKEIWRVRYDGYSVVPRPVYGCGLVFVSTGFDFPNLLAIRPGGQGDVTESHVAWTLKRGVPHNPSPLLIGDELCIVSDLGIASCLDARTGKVHWQERLGGNFSASPLFADGKLYFQNEDGIASVIKAGKEFALLAKNDIGERTLASYAAADGALFLRTEQHLYRIEATGRGK